MSGPTTTPGTEDDPPPRGVRRLLSRLPAGSRRTPWINGGLAGLLVVAVILAFTVIGNPTPPPAPLRTAVVTRGNVTATVTGTGNAASQTAIPLSFDTDGTVLTLNVKAGDTVTTGEVLATVDARASQESLRSAQASLDNAQGALNQATGGPTDAKKQQDQQAITEAQQDVANARQTLSDDRSSADTNVKTARVQLSTDTTAQNTAVSNARTNESAACDGVQLDAYVVAADPTTTSGPSSTRTTSTRTSAPTTSTPTTSTRPTTTTRPTATTSRPTATTSRPTSTTSSPGTTGGLTTAPSSSPSAPSGGVTSTGTGGSATSTSTSSGSASSCTQAKQDVKNAENTRDQTLQKDRLAITSAEQDQNTNQDKDQQAITTAQGQVRDAQLALQSDLNPSTAAQIQQARANVDSSRVGVQTAQRNLDGTVLKAPIAGVVLAVNGKVGESSSQTSSANTNNSTSTSGANTASAASASASSAGQGFLAIANPSQLKVTANIAEADAANLQLGQQATVAFPATDDSATGTVTEIQPQSTVTNNVVLYPVEVSLDTAPNGVKTGSTADLTITNGQATSVLQVPSAAVTTTGTTHTVTVQSNGTQTVVPVGVGLTGPTTTEITSGLTEGDVVVLPTPAATNTAPTNLPRLGGGR